MLPSGDKGLRRLCCSLPRSLAQRGEAEARDDKKRITGGEMGNLIFSMVSKSSFTLGLTQPSI